MLLAYPSNPRRVRIYWIEDNLSTDWTRDSGTFAGANTIELVATPTDARQLSQLRRMSLCRSASVVVKNADFPDWGAFARVRSAHHRPQRRAPRPTPHQFRMPMPDRCLTKTVAGESFRNGPLADLPGDGSDGVGCRSGPVERLTVASDLTDAISVSM
jgi:hypothetical protein